MCGLTQITNPLCGSRFAALKGKYISLYYTTTLYNAVGRIKPINSHKMRETLLFTF